MMKALIYLTIIISILSTVTSGIITPDDQNPLLMYKPTIGKGNAITIRFKLPRAIQYHQFIGVAFPKALGAIDLFLDTYDSISERISCGLTDTDGNKLIVVSVTSQYENNVLYCRNDDTVNKLIPDKLYILTLTLNSGFTVSVNLARTVSLFTSTSNTSDKIILDYIPVVGTLALYKDWTKTTTPILDITLITALQGTQPVTTIYPYSTFDLSVNFKVNTSYITADSLIVIKFPKNTSGTQVILPKDIISYSILPTDPLQTALKGVLSVKSFTDDSFIIAGITEELIPNRQFQIIFKNIKALDTNISQPITIEAWVYYLNSYAVMSYKSLTAFTINPITVTFKNINHPENINIFSGAAWPMQFDFQTNSDLVNGGYVLIQQINTIDGNNKWSFSSSTCDFTDNSLSILPTRPICFPLNNDLKYKNASSKTAYAGSGIIFKLDKILQANTLITLKIWGVAENCGTTNDPTKNTSYTTFSFTMTIYKSIDQLYKSGINRLTDNINNTANQILAVSQPTSTLNTCFSSTDKIDYTGSLLTASVTTGENLMYKEISDFQVIKADSSYTCADANTCYSANVKTATPTSIYLNSGTIPTKNFFLLKGNFNVEKGKTLKEYFPLPLTKEFAAQPGRLYVQVSKAYVTDGDYKSTNSCVLSWNFLVDDGTTASNASNKYSLTQAAYAAAGGGANNYITTTDTIDKTKLQLPSDKPLSMNQIPTIFDASQDKFSIIKEKEAACGPDNQCNKSRFLIYSNCLTIKTEVIKIKSLYSYFDTQVLFQYMDKSSSNPITTRVIRFIKMFPEYDVYNDKNNFYKAAGNILTLHYAFGESSDKNAVCIIQVNGQYLKAFIDADININSGANALIFFMYNLNLLDTDYSLMSLNYPVLTSTPNAIAGNANNNSIILNPSNRSNAYYTPKDSNSLNVTKINSTYYLNYLSSTLTIFDLNKFSTTYAQKATDLLIPTLCPYYESATTAFTLPVVTIQAFNIDSTSEVISNKINFMKNNNDLISITPVTGIAPNFTLSKKGTINTPGLANVSLLRFNRYTSSPDDNILNIFSGTINQTGINTNCSGYVFLISSDFTVDPTKLKIVVGDSNFIPYYFNNEYSVYFSGKPFTEFIVGANTTPLQLKNTSKASDTNTESSSNYLVGISRPTLDIFYNNGKFITTDKIGFFCTSSANTDLSYLTNLVIDNNKGSKVNNFILDFNPDLSMDYTIKTFQNDKTVEPIYKLDNGGNFELIFTLPNNPIIPTGALISLSSNYFTPNSLCGIFNDNTYSTFCTNSDIFSNFNCPITTQASQFDIICHNLLINTSSIVLSDLSIIFPINPSISNLNNYISTKIFSGSKISFVANTSGTSVDELKGSKITSMYYTYANQEKGIGKIYLEILISRELTRDSKIVISSNIFSDLFIANVTPRCTVTTNSNSYETSDTLDTDSLIESCNINNSLNSIIILTKAEIFKRNLTTSKLLRIRIWPVNEINPISYINNKYALNITTRVTNSYLIPNNVYLDFPLVTFQKGPSARNYNIQPIYYENLCNVLNIYPRIVDEFAYYDFEFDIYSNYQSLAALVNVLPNEFSIFMPFNEFGEIFPNIKCFYLNDPSNSNKVGCANDTEGVITINFANGIDTYNGVNPIIRVVGFTNPNIDNSNLRIPCTVNYNDGVRTNLIIGTGLLINTLSYPGISVTNFGNLRIINTKSTLSDTNPRSKGVFTLRLAFDNNFSAFPTSVPSAHIIITFPDQFNFNYFNNLYIQVKVDQYDADKDGNTIYSATLDVKSVYLFKNSVDIEFENTLTLSATFRYWIISLGNVPAPFDTTTTSYIKILLTNPSFTVIYKTFTNLNTFATNPLVTAADSLSNSLITSTRGFNYVYDYNKFTIDVTQSEVLDPNTVNRITLTPGVYSKFAFRTRPNSVIIISSSTSITLYDSTFLLGQSSYLITSSMDKTDFIIGTPCSTPKGVYYITFTISNTNQFLSLPPILVNVLDVNPIPLSIVIDPNVKQGSSQLIFYNLRDLNVDQFSINWTGDLSDDASASISPIIIPPQSTSVYTIFQISNPGQTNSQIFITSNPNSCIDISMKTIKISLNNSIDRLSNYNFKDFFYYYNSLTNPAVAKNAVRFQFNSPMTPIYFFCGISCYDSDYLNNSDIKQGMTSSKGFSKYYSNYIGPSNKVVTFEFKNLMRGQRYKMRCIIQTTETNINIREEVVLDFNDITLNYNGNQVVAQIITPKQTDTMCLRFKFDSEPGFVIRDALLKYCQTSFNSQGGCVVCTDDSGNSLIGMKSYYWCNIDGSDEYSLPQFGYADPNGLIYTMCAVQDKYCDSDVMSNGYVTIMNQMMLNLSTPVIFSSTLNLPMTSFNKVEIFTDDVPQLEKIIVQSNMYFIDKGGMFQIPLYSVDPFLCFWRITTSNMAGLTTDDLLNCRDSSRCGSLKVNAGESWIMADQDNLRIFQPGLYYINMACFNDMPNPTMLSDIRVINKFKINPFNFTTATDSGFSLRTNLVIIFLIFILII